MDCNFVSMFCRDSGKREDKSSETSPLGEERRETGDI